MARVASGVKSGPSRNPCYLRFINRTSRKVNIIWLDYNGKYRNYGTLHPLRHFDIHSYEGHPWISEDCVTKTRMLLNRKEIYFPLSCDQYQDNRENRCYLPVLSNNEVINHNSNWKRQFIFITLPMFPLVELSAEAVVKNLRIFGEIRSLVIPDELKGMLQSYYFVEKSVPR